MTAPLITKQISKNIKKYRKEHGYTQAHLAELIDMEIVSISRIETGDYNISLKSLENFAKIFNVSILDLLREDAEGVDDQAKHLADILIPLSKEERTSIINIVKEIVSVRKG